MTTHSTLIPMDRPGRLLQKTRDYLVDMDAFLYDTAGAVTILLDTLPHADTALILKMLPLLGYAGKDRVLWPLFNLMISASTDGQVRRSAAVQLGLAASLSEESSPLQTALIENLKHSDPAVRSSCALALGWEGNWPAVAALMAHLQDPDHEVQTAVVVALSSMGDVRVFDHLVGCLEVGSVEEQRSILLNLWRFTEQTHRVETVYLRWLDRLGSDVRLAALAALAMVPFSTSIREAYRRLLLDEDPRIRLQTIENLSTIDPKAFEPLRGNLQELLADQDAQVRQEVIRLFARASNQVSMR